MAFGAIELQVNQDATFPYLEMVSQKIELIESKINDSLNRNLETGFNTKINIEFANISHVDGLFLRQMDSKKIILSFSIIHSDSFEQVLTHEVFHAIHDNLKKEEESWVREGLAQMFEYIILEKYNSTNVSQSFQQNVYFFSHYSLSNNDRSLYGQHFLYFYYLFNHCGGHNLFWKLATLDTDKKGVELINKVLKTINSPKKQCTNFTQSFIYFQISRLVNSYTMKDDSLEDHFFLIPTRAKMSEEDFISSSFFMDPRPFSVLFTNKEQVINISSPQFIQFWIKRSAPYTITNDINTLDDSSWTQVFIRL